MEHGMGCGGSSDERRTREGDALNPAREPPAFLLKPKRPTLTPAERIARYRLLLDEINALANSDWRGRNHYWTEHALRLRYLMMGRGGL
jgi:hypothetical protein